MDEQTAGPVFRPKPAHTQAEMLAALDEVFGFRHFRPGQQEIVQAILAGRDVFAVMPTGGGKSLCYQLPAHMLQGTCLVISPLISLMKDQVDAAQANGLRAEFLNSSLPAGESRRILNLLSRRELDLLYLAPERFAMEHFLPVLKTIPVCLVAVDEAHCISEWGHDFRKDYLLLARIIPEFPNVPVAAFTATATHQVQQDIIERLGLRDPFKVRLSFDRPNLFYQVLAKKDVEQQILKFVQARPEESGIVYRMTRAAVEDTAGYLRAKGIKAVPYHAGLAPEVRKRHQEMFNRDEVNVVVATIAFGMGIDKANVRFVVHGDLPKNLESYYQETGRGGRDGESAQCVLFYTYADVAKLGFFVRQVEDAVQRAISQQKLDQMAKFGSSGWCRRRQLLNYFGEQYRHENCRGCDICMPNAKKVEATQEAQMLMSAAARTREQHGGEHLVNIVLGVQSPAVLELGHHELRTFGVGKQRAAAYWRELIEDLLIQGCLCQGPGDSPPLKITAKGADVLFGRQRLVYLKPAALPVQEVAKQAQELPEVSPPAEQDYDETLFARLRALRQRLAKEQNVLPFVVLSDRTLHDMARELPVTLVQMRKIGGVGKQKLRQYGFEFISLIGAYVRERGLVKREEATAARAARPKRRARGDSAEATWRLARQGLTIQEIAVDTGKAESTIVGHFEELILRGRAVDIRPYVSADARRRIEGLFAAQGTAALRPIIEAGNGEVTYAQARLVRAAMLAKKRV